MIYLQGVLIMFCIYMILVQSLNIASGYGGLLSLAQAAFYGIGAYAAGLLMVHLHWPFLPSAFAAVSVTALLAWLVSFPATRLQGSVFILGTLGFQIIVFETLYNWESLTGGQHGLEGVPKPELFGLRFVTSYEFLLLASLAALLSALLIARILSSPFGRVLQAVREDEIAAASLGKDVAAIKRAALTISAAFAGVAGVLFATYSSYIDPTSFELTESIFILSMLIIGGAGNLTGAIVGAALLVFLPEALRFVGLSEGIAAHLRQIIYGTALIAMMRWRPQGIAGRYAFD